MVKVKINSGGKKEILDEVTEEDKVILEPMLPNTQIEKQPTKEVVETREAEVKKAEPEKRQEADKTAVAEVVSPSPVAQVNLEDAFGDIFKTTKSGTGEEELLRIASQFSLQLTGAQMKCLSYLIHRSEKSLARPEPEQQIQGQLLKEFVIKWLEYKQNNNSDVFVMKALEHISLRHFINENSFKVSIDK